ncbi:LPS export ABC transporter periplasmic protein LptC [Undibacterium sp. Ren11W]|uniref:LPS export ABC transporter periplasmic protein LptC n=1 Tax=Undibacterium sp. Ren11W TaxID=3413045 RepID=UPI003BF272C8
MKYHLTADQFRIWLGVVLLALVALASFWILKTLRQNGDDANARSSVRSEPDYYVEKFNFIRLPNNGQANVSIVGDKLTHYPRSDDLEIQQARINSFSADKSPVNIRALRAVIEQKSTQTTPIREHDQIHLLGDVQVERPATRTSSFMQLNSDYLLVLPDENTMKTDTAVTMITTTSEIHAVGMTADNNTQQVQLLSKVRARFSRAGAAQKPLS